MELSLDDNAQKQELIRKDIQRHNAEFEGNRRLSLYKRTLKHGQVYKSAIILEDANNVYFVCITESGVLSVYEMIDEDVVKRFEKKVHMRLINLISLKHLHELKFGLCTESDVLIVCELQRTPFDIVFEENLFGDFEINNNGLNFSSFKHFDLHNKDILVYSDSSIVVYYKDDYDLDNGDVIVNEDRERQIILSAKFIVSENDTANYILTIEDYNIVKLYYIDRISGRLHKRSELKLSEYAIYMFLQVLDKTSVYINESLAERSNKRRRRESDLVHVLINGEDGRLLMLEINLDMEDIKIVSNNKLPIPKSLVASNKKSNKNILPMVVCMKSQSIVDSDKSFILLLTHLGDLLQVSIEKNVANDEISYNVVFSQFNKLELSKAFDFITTNNCLFVLPQFGIPKIYRINNLNTNLISQVKYDDTKFEYDSLEVISEFPDHFLKTPLLSATEMTENDLEVFVDGKDVFCKSFKLEEKMRINIVDDEHHKAKRVFEVKFENKTKLLFFAFNDNSRILHFNEEDEIAEIDSDDAVNSGVFILKETTINVIKYNEYLLQFTRNKLNIIRIVDADKFILFKRVNLKKLLPHILEYTSSIEITNCDLIAVGKQAMVLVSLNNYKFFYFDFLECINSEEILSYMVLSEIDAFMSDWRVYVNNKKMILLFTLTNDNILNIYEISSTLLEGDQESSDDPLVSKFFNTGVNSFVVTAVEEDTTASISCHIGFNDGLYEVYKFDLEDNHLESLYQTYLNVHPLTLHYLNHIGSKEDNYGTVIISSIGSYWVCELKKLANRVGINIRHLYLKGLEKQIQGDISICDFSNDLVLESDSANKKNGAIIVDSEGELIFLLHDSSTINHTHSSEDESISVLGADEYIDKNITLIDSKNLKYHIIPNGSSFHIKYDVPQHLKNKFFKGMTVSETKTFNYEISSALIVEYSDRSLFQSNQLGKYIIVGTKDGKLLTFKINNNPKAIPENNSKDSSTERSEEAKVDLSTLSKSQKKRLKKKQQGKENTSEKLTNSKIDVDSYDYNYLTLTKEQVFSNNTNSIKILRAMGREKHILTILKGSVLTIFKLSDNTLETLKESKTVPSLTEIIQVDFFHNDLLMVAADIVGNIVYHRYLPESKIFIPLADYKVSNNYSQVTKFLDAKTILKTDRFGNVSVLALNVPFGVKDLLNMEYNGILPRIYSVYEGIDFSKNRDDNVWDLPFKFDKIASIYMGDIIKNVIIIKENSIIRNSRPIILCFGLQGSVTLLMPLIDQREVDTMKHIQEIIDDQEDKSYGVSQLRYESTFELSKSIYDADYYHNALIDIDLKSFEVLQNLQNANHLE